MLENPTPSEHASSEAQPQPVAERVAQLQQAYRNHLRHLNPDPMHRMSFDFSTIFPPAERPDVLIKQVDDLKRCLDSFRPLSPEQTANLAEAFEIEYTFESNRIEGNTLTLQETALVIQKGVTIQGKSLREHLEAINHQAALDYVKEIASGALSLDERVLKTIHQLILQGIDRKNAGRYRQVDVRIAGSEYVPPPHFRLPELMEGYFASYKQHKDQKHPVLLAADMHEKLVTIHPFIDGNGRTGRLVMNLILLRYGYPIANISGDPAHRSTYYDALAAVQMEGDPTVFHRFILQAVKASFFRYLDLIASSAEEGKGGYFFERIANALK